MQHMRETHPSPVALKVTDIWNDTQQSLRTPIHRLGSNVAKPHSQLWREIITGQLQHSHISAAVQIQRIDDWHWRYGRPEILVRNINNARFKLNIFKIKPTSLVPFPRKTGTQPYRSK